MLSHGHLHQRSLPARLQGRPALPTTQPLESLQPPRPLTDHRPPAPRPRTTGPKDFRGPQGPRPQASLSSQRSRERTGRQKEPGWVPSPRPLASPGPAGGQWSAPRKFASPEAEPSLPYISAGRAPPGRPRRRVACSQPRRRLPFIHSLGGGWRLPAEAGAGRERERGRDAEGPEPGAPRPFSRPD